MSIESVIKITVAVCGLLAGFYGRRLCRYWRRRQFGKGFQKGDRITIESTSGTETYTVKNVKRSTITLRDDWKTNPKVELKHQVKS